MTLNQLHQLYYPEFQKAFVTITAGQDLFQSGSVSDSKSIDFDYLTQVSSVFSSKIEGNSLDLNSYFNQVQLSKSTKSKEASEILDLSQAYHFAKSHSLTQANLLKAHRMTTKSFLEGFQSGQYRQSPVGVFGSRGLVYMAVESELVQQEMENLLVEIKQLLKSNSKSKLNSCEAIFYACLIHLIIAQIHPFNDGNGRMARLAEKWFLAQLLGENIWSLQPEKYIFENKSQYYSSINLGLDYYNLDYSKANQFLQLIARSYL
jgi:Fic family protein